MTPKQIGEFIRTKVDDDVAKVVQDAATVPRFREKVMRSDILGGIKRVARLDPKEGLLGKYSPATQTAFLLETAGKSGVGTTADTLAHEILHGFMRERKWVSELGSVNFTNPEMRVLHAEWRDSISRIATKLSVGKGGEASDVAADMLREFSKEGFGASYEKGIPQRLWQRIESFTGFGGSREFGVARGYSLANQEEYATTHFEFYVRDPERLKQVNPRMFEFFDSFYTTGEFKELVDWMRRATWNYPVG